jgi:hypothetical protein
MISVGIALESKAKTDILLSSGPLIETTLALMAMQDHVLLAFYVRKSSYLL